MDNVQKQRHEKLFFKKQHGGLHQTTPGANPDETKTSKPQKQKTKNEDEEVSDYGEKIDQEVENVSSNLSDLESLQEENIDKEKEINMKWFIKGNGPARLRWDIFIILLSIYNSITIPISIAFQPEILNHTYITIFDAVVDLIFLLDIIISFRTTHLDTVSGADVTDSHKIAAAYL